MAANSIGFGWICHEAISTAPMLDWVFTSNHPSLNNVIDDANTYLRSSYTSLVTSSATRRSRFLYRASFSPERDFDSTATNWNERNPLLLNIRVYHLWASYKTLLIILSHLRIYAMHHRNWCSALVRSPHLSSSSLPWLDSLVLLANSSLFKLSRLSLFSRFYILYLKVFVKSHHCSIITWRREYQRISTRDVLRGWSMKRGVDWRAKSCC